MANSSDEAGVKNLQELTNKVDLMSTQLERLIRAVRVGNLADTKVFEFAFRDQKIRFCLPFAEFDVIQGHILSTGHFFENALLEIIKTHIKPGSVILDIGANIGNHTVFFAKFCNPAQIFSFEPGNVAYDILIENIALNNLSNVMPVKRVVGSEIGSTQLQQFNPRNIGGTSFQKISMPGSYELISIDSLELDRIDFMKIDVEGAHREVLAGAKRSLMKCRPLIWIELREKANEFESGMAALQSLGYQVKEKLSPNDYLFEPSTA